MGMRDAYRNRTGNKIVIWYCFNNEINRNFMSTTFNYEIYFDKKMTDEESTVFCKLMEEATTNPKLIISQAIGEDFVKGFVAYCFSGMDKENSIKYFIQQINTLDYKLEIKNCN